MKIESLQKSLDLKTLAISELEHKIESKDKDLFDARNLLHSARLEINQNEENIMGVNQELENAFKSAQFMKNSNVDKSKQTEIHHLRKLVRKYEKETIMYKELLTTTSRYFYFE